MLALLEHQFEKGSVKIRRELAAGVVPVVGFEFKLQQVFLNLFLNARDAMPSGGWLTMATRVDGHEVVAEVSDTGSGIPSEHLARIYDPFFTTKPIGQGTGLGLSITYGIVREHEASIQCQSAPGQGTRFTLRFKLATDERDCSDVGVADVGAGAIGMRRNGSDSRHRRRRNHAGDPADPSRARRVWRADRASGQEGLDLARALPFDAVIVDVMMPGIDGLQVLEELKKQDDNLPVLMITAFASMDTAIKAMKLGAFDYITKPFKNDEVLVVLRNAIEHRRLRDENVELRRRCARCTSSPGSSAAARA